MQSKAKIKRKELEQEKIQKQSKTEQKLHSARVQIDCTGSANRLLSVRNAVFAENLPRAIDCSLEKTEKQLFK